MSGVIRKTFKGTNLKRHLLKFYNVLSVPVLLYGSEVWVLTREDDGRIQEADEYLKAMKGWTTEDRLA